MCCLARKASPKALRGEEWGGIPRSTLSFPRNGVICQMLSYPNKQDPRWFACPCAERRAASAGANQPIQQSARPLSSAVTDRGNQSGSRREFSDCRACLTRSPWRTPVTGAQKPLPIRAQEPDKLPFIQRRTAAASRSRSSHFLLPGALGFNLCSAPSKGWVSEYLPKEHAWIFCVNGAQKGKRAALQRFIKWERDREGETGEQRRRERREGGESWGRKIFFHSTQSEMMSAVNEFPSRVLLPQEEEKQNAPL